MGASPARCGVGKATLPASLQSESHLYRPAGAKHKNVTLALWTWPWWEYLYLKNKHIQCLRDGSPSTGIYRISWETLVQAPEPRRRKSPPQSCPMISTGVLWHVCTHTHTHTHSYKIKILSANAELGVTVAHTLNSSTWESSKEHCEFGVTYRERLS